MQRPAVSIRALARAAGAIPRAGLPRGAVAAVLAVLTASACHPPRQTDTEIPAPSPQLTLERIHQGEPLWGSPPRGAEFSPDGTRLTFLRGSAMDAQVLDLWAIDLAAQPPKPALLVAASDLVEPASIQLSEEERMALERRREGGRGITSYSWCGERGKRLLFPLGGHLYVYDLEAETKLTRVTTTEAARLDPRCSPHGTYVSWVEGGNVYVAGSDGSAAMAVTTDATQTRKFGLAEFVAQEEMGRYDGHWWSPDEKYLAYTEVDESGVAVKVRPRIYAEGTQLYEQRYPAAGEANASVRLHVREHQTGDCVEVPLPSEDGYLPRVGWHGDHTLDVQWQSRDQKLLRLSAGTSPDFELTTLVEERDDAWVELHNDLHFLDDGRFLWPSEKSGVRQLYLHGPDGAPLAQVTDGPDPVTALAGVDRDNVYYQRATDRGLRSHLFRARLGSPGVEHRVSREEGSHSVRMADDGGPYLDYYSRTFEPVRVSVHAPTGDVLFVLDDNPAPEWRALRKPPVEFVEVKASDGTILNGRLVAPLDAQPGQKYPVIVYTYGGPTGPIVLDRFGGDAYTLFLAERGFGVFTLDNRGVGGRDRAFGRAFYNRFGDIEVEDQLAGARWLSTVPWVDADHIGVWGWSYGGYTSALLIMADDTPFAAAAAVAPVTDWRLYDTHYTERYIGTPQANADAYERSSVLARAEHLEQPLLLVHGMADDNVLFEHTLALMSRLQDASIPFELMVYPGRAHGLRGKGTRLHVYRTITNFFARHLLDVTPSPRAGGPARPDLD